MKGDTQRFIRNSLHDVKDDSFIIILMLAIYNLTRNNEMNPNNYFTQNEIIKAQNKDYTPTTEYIDFPLKLERVLKVTENDYIGVLPSRLLIALHNSKKLYNNYDSDHNTVSIKRKYSDKVVKRIKFIRKEIMRIYESISSNSYMHDQMTLNVVKDIEVESSEEVMFYDEDNLILTINDTRIDIIDGYHLFEALKMKHMEDNDFNLNIQVAIKRYSKEDANKYLEQEIR